jgi:D-3-phosphoglycerate dehydrogenase
VERYRILIADSIDEGGIALLRDHAQVDVRTGLAEAELVRIINDYDALVVRSQTKVTGPVLHAGQRLQVVGRAGTGYDNIDVVTATNRGIVVVNAPTGNTIAAAEHTIAMMLALARHVPQADAAMRRGEWTRGKFVGVEVRDKVLGVIGLGRIGVEVTKRAQGLAMRVVAYDPFVSSEVADRLGVPLLPLGELLGMADFVTLHTPLTAQTKHLIGARALELMKPTARLINCARGELVDQAALLAALDTGRLAGAALDVFPDEPPIGNPLVGHPRVICTPHLGASTAEAQANVARDVAVQVLAVLEGRIAGHAVNAPLVSAETLAVLVPFIDLVERMGRLSVQIGGERIGRLRLAYSGKLCDHDLTPLRAAAVKGLLEQVVEERINLVNANLVARRRGIEIVEEKTTQPDRLGDLVTLEVTTDQGTRSVTGTVVRGEPHIVGIDGYWVDIVPAGYLLISHNRDQPGVIGRVGTILGNANVNIAFMQVGRDAPRGQALMILGLDDPMPPELFAELSQVPALYDAKLVKL